MKHDEMVVAVRASRVHAVLERLGRGPLYSARSIPSVLSEMSGEAWHDERVIAPRSFLETDVEWKQPISYVLVHRDGEVLCATRSRDGDPRLRSRVSIGFGGHVSLDDVIAQGGFWVSTGLPAAMGGNTRRELKEELGAEGGDIKAVALLDDNSDAVGTVHFGVVALWQAPPLWKPTASSEHTSFEWCGPKRLLERRDEMESWSKILVDDLLDSSGVTPSIVR